MTTHPRCSCGKRARYFGRFAGGVCLDHAMTMIDMFPNGYDQFWPEHRAELKDRHEARNGRTSGRSD